MDSLGLWPFSSSVKTISYTNVSPTWEELNSLLRSKETIAERTDYDSEKVGRGPTNHRADIRLFDAPEGFEPEVVLYRDQAAWCPYCEKVLQIKIKVSKKTSLPDTVCVNIGLASA